MKYLVNSSQAKAIDTYTIQQTGIPSLVLMERAALAVADSVIQIASKDSRKAVSICAVCGNGNNGGDGIAAARILFGKGYHVTIALAGNREKMSDDARKQLEIAEKLSVPIINEMQLESYNIIIDALFGIGLTRNITGSFAEWIDAVNHAAQKGAQICSVDMPSGISTDSGAIMGTAVKADMTVTFGYVKLGMIFYPGASFAGRIICADIGFDKKAEPASGVHYLTYTDEDMLRLPMRQADSHKGIYGPILIIAGSHNMAGAAYFSAKAAYRMGAGLVTVYTPESNRVILQTLLPDAVLNTYADASPDMAVLDHLMTQSQIIVLGPGLGQSEPSMKIVQAVMAQAKVPVIIDADALNILSVHAEWLKNKSCDAVITPHLKELSRLTGYNIQYIKENREQVCKTFTQDNSVICISKDARTFVMDSSDNIYINTSGNSGMSVGGSGDVLTGMIAGLYAQKMSLPEASRLAVFLHGKAGDAASERMSMHAMTASDLLEAIPEVLKKAEKQQENNRLWERCDIGG
jgi:NAD(P)H-hydrate epimerase